LIAFWHRLARLQARHPGVLLALFAALAALGGWRASHLTVVTDFADLLDPQQASVVELRRIAGRVRGQSTVQVVLEGSDAGALRVAADALLPPLRALGSPAVESARSGVQEARRFLMPRAGLFLSAAELDDVERQVRERESWEFRRRVGADLDEPPPPINQSDLEARLERRLGPAARYPDGYYQAATPGGFANVVVVKSAVVSGDLAGAQKALEQIRAAVERTMAGRSGVTVGYAGDLVTMLAEYGLVRADILDVGVVGLAAILAVVVAFFRSARALVVLGLTIAVGCAMTFGVTERTLGHLNVATAFLLSVVAGNGINFGIIWLARYLEERRQGRTLETALAEALARTCPATLAAAGAAAAAYSALGVARFRGFQHFALIGATGMSLCWLASYLFLPALVAALERIRPAVAPRATARFERPFLWLVTRAAGPTLFVTALVGGIALLAGGRYLWRDPLEYDMRHLRSDPQTTGEVYRAGEVAGAVLGAGGPSGMVVLTDDPRDTPVAAALLRQVRDRAPSGARPFEEVHTLDQFVPPDQETRLLRLRALARRLERIHERGGIDDPTWARLSPLLPPPDLPPFGAADLPPEISEPFTERDGTRGRILFIQPTVGQSDADLHYLLRFTDAFRQTTLPDGRIIRGSGRAVIFADLLGASLVDMPRSVLTSLVMTIGAVILLFRRPRPVATVVGSLVLALVWMMGFLAAVGVRLSFINFIALPITFGIGIDYAVNVYGRYTQEPKAGMVGALRGTGGAVILCSLTTSLGYLALLRAHNSAVRSLGAVAVLGEVSCLVTAVLVLPALFAWRDRRSEEPAVVAERSRPSL
jgi:predicted RND superfamily exporter protein